MDIDDEVLPRHIKPFSFDENALGIHNTLGLDDMRSYWIMRYHLFILRHIADVLPGVAEVWQVISDRMEAVLISNPVNSVGDSFPGVRVRATPHVVASLRLVARVGDAFFACFDPVRCLKSG